MPKTRLEDAWREDMDLAVHYSTLFEWFAEALLPYALLPGAGSYQISLNKPKVKGVKDHPHKMRWPSEYVDVFF